MTPFTALTGRACPLGLANVDTDQLIPARFMSRPREAGYGDCLLHDLRFDEAGAERPDFPLNREPWRGAPILVARRNWGSGSSREAAVYALADYGVRCVIAPSFGDIHASNLVKNGLLPARVGEAEAEALLAALEAEPALPFTVDLRARTVAPGEGAPIPFAIDEGWRAQLLHGWDDLDVTLARRDALDAFKAADAARRPWARPGTG